MDVASKRDSVLQGSPYDHYNADYNFIDDSNFDVPNNLIDFYEDNDPDDYIYNIGDELSNKAQVEELLNHYISKEPPYV